MYRSILFDFDGTLAETMEDHFKAWKTVLASYGVFLKPEDYFPLEGSSVSELASLFSKRISGQTVDPQEILRKKEQAYLSSLKTVLYPGVEQLIARLKAKNTPIGIVTAGLRHRLYASVSAEFLDQFDVLITGESSSFGKPHPEPYLLGAKGLGIKPSEIIVVENSPFGIQSAKAAGSYCIAVCSTLPRSFLQEADEIIESIAELETVGVMQGLGFRNS